jgi:hypothetical protein
VFEKDKVLYASLNKLGEIIVGDICYSDFCDLELDDFPPVRWGNGYKGTAATQFPHPTCTHSKTQESPSINSPSATSPAS